MKKNRLILVIGVANILIGLFFLYCGFREIPAFFLLSRGAAAYEGFGFGSFMFAFIVFWMYVYGGGGIALVFLGIGFIRREWWAWRLSRTLMMILAGTGCLLVLGTASLFFPFLNDYDAGAVNPGEILFVIGFIAVVFLALPLLYFMLLGNRKLIAALQQEGRLNSHLAVFPSEILAFAMACVFFLLILTFLIFLKSIFPFMGVLAKNLPGFLGILASLCAVVFILINLIRRKSWIRPVSLVFFAALTVSSAVSFSLYSVSDFCRFIGFPEAEMKIISGMGLLVNFRPVFLACFPLSCVILLLRARHFFSFSGFTQSSRQKPRFKD